MVNLRGRAHALQNWLRRGIRRINAKGSRNSEVRAAQGCEKGSQRGETVSVQK